MKTTKEIIKRAEKSFNLVNKTHISFWKLLRNKKYKKLVRFIERLNKFDRVVVSFADFFDEEDKCLDIEVNKVNLHWFFESNMLLFCCWNENESCLFANDIKFRNLKDIPNLISALSTRKSINNTVNEIIKILGR